VFRELAAQYRDIEPRHLYIDALVLLMVQNPEQFDVIVTNNLFGDIITDLGAALQGGLGLAASGNLHPGRTSMFEPVHGSAPPLAGKNIANPMGAILSAALMLDYLGWPQEAAAIEAAVHDAVVNGQGTREIGGPLGTAETGDYIASRIMLPEPRSTEPQEARGEPRPGDPSLTAHGQPSPDESAPRESGGAATLDAPATHDRERSSFDG
ncbi:MAG TPA: isocitrate/isopropylmalate family dehydrogenase, partial [Vicinamibacterales bacterium]|nr:isocitrate/isopropylmalate family dehydrogenase [Vicinamibacterales bacterium]